MNGSVGLHLAKKRKQGVFVLKRRSRNLRAECVARVVGQAVLIVEMLDEEENHINSYV